MVLVVKAGFEVPGTLGLLRSVPVWCRSPWSALIGLVRNCWCQALMPVDWEALNNLSQPTALGPYLDAKSRSYGADPAG